MLVILPVGEYGKWLDCSVQNLESWQVILCPYPGDDLIAYPVSVRVNNPAHDAPECVLPLP
jgi:putative SOS response-associated peptidase YedK